MLRGPGVETMRRAKGGWVGDSIAEHRMPRV